MEQRINQKELYIPIKVTTKQKTLNDVDNQINIRYQQYKKKLFMDYFDKKAGQTEVSPNKLDFNNSPIPKKKENLNKNLKYLTDFKTKELNIVSSNNQKIQYYHQVKPVKYPISTKKDKKIIFPMFKGENHEKKDEFFLPKIIKGENNKQKIKNERLYYSIDYESERMNYNKYLDSRETEGIYENIGITEKLCESFTTLTSICSISAIDDIIDEKENAQFIKNNRTIENAVQNHLKQASKNIKKIKNNFESKKDEKYLFQIN